MLKAPQLATPTSRGSRVAAWSTPEERLAVQIPCCRHDGASVARFAPLASQVISRAVTTLDLTATIAHAAGMRERPTQHFDGVSLLPLLTDTPGQEEFPSHLYWFGTLGDAAVQSGDWKLRVGYNTFLFNITSDPLELYNLANKHQVHFLLACSLFCNLRTTY